MEINEWWDRHPFVEPCIYCEYFKDGEGLKMELQVFYMRKHYLHYTGNKLYFCWWGWMHNQLRDTEPWTGKCKYFTGRKNYKYLEDKIR